MTGITVIFFLNDKKLSSHTAQIIEHINSSNQKNHSHDKSIKMDVNLGSKKCENNDTSICQLTRRHNSLLVSIVNTTDKYLSNIDRKLDRKKVRTSSVKSSSKLFSC